MPTDQPEKWTTPTSDNLAHDRDGNPTEAEQPVLKDAQDSGNDATGGTGIETAIAQA